MGQRANLIIATKDSYELYYNHWCANTITRDLFWGSQHAINFIKAQKKVDNENGWLDERWAEGGAVVDIERKVLLIYGGEDLKYDIPLRRVYLKLLAQVWNGWDIRWANEGIADFADYVGYPKEKVLTEYENEENNPSFSPPDEKDWVNVIGSVKFGNDDVVIFPLDGDVEEYLFNGRASLNEIKKSYAYKEIKLSDWTSDFPIGGFHIDIVDKSIDFWIAKECPGLLDKLKSKWNGWILNCSYDKFEIQIEYSNKKIEFNIPSMDDLLNRLKEMLLQDCQDPVDSYVHFSERMNQEGKKVEINPWALENKRVNVGMDSQKEILNDAIKRLKLNCNK